MDLRAAAVVLGLIAGCRDPNPYFVEPSTATTGATTTGDATAPSTTDEPATTLETSTTTLTVGDGDASAETGTTSTTTGAVCQGTQIVCEGSSAKVCDGNGGYASSTECELLCLDGFGCAVCSPGDAQCAGSVVQACDQTGQWQDVETCDALQGLDCDPDFPACAGACAPYTLGTSHVGCDFYAATLPSLHATDPPWSGEFAVAVVNDGDTAANITVTVGATISAVKLVPAGAAETITLPYVDALDHPFADDVGPTQVVDDGAYRVRSDRPVTVYQYEPIAPETSGDASLLLPTHTWGMRHMIAAREHRPSFLGTELPGFYVVVARDDATTLTLSPSWSSFVVSAGDGVGADGSGEVLLDAGDALVVFSAATGMDYNTDLTGTIVEADRPVGVFAGHKCADVPAGIQICDHLEESMPPIDALARSYVIATHYDQFNLAEPQVVRLIATEADTTVLFDPVIASPVHLDEAGTWVDLPVSAASVRVLADNKILIAQYMTGGNNANIDTSLTVAIPTDHFRDRYRIFAATGYPNAGATLIAETGAAVLLDGVPVEGFEAVGSSGYGVSHVTLTGGDGSHLLTGDAPFGVAVYGYAPEVSWYYPGGRELAAIP